MPDDDPQFKYKAFISYSHRDEKWGQWLHRGIERYRVPKAIIGRDTLYGPVPRRLFPVFRDREELPTAADLSEVISKGLRDSSHLIVICSPHAAKSQWVNEEVLTFKKLGKQNRIVCLIVDGEPNVLNKPELGLEECFPPALKVVADEDGNLTDIEAEPIAADARPDKDGKANSMMKVLSGLLGVGFDEIKQRDLARKHRQAAILGIGSAVLAGVMGLLTVWAVINKNEAVAAKDEAEERLYRSQILQAANFAEEKNYGLATRALLEAPARFRNFEWGFLLRKANPQLTVLEGDVQNIYSLAVNPDGTRLATGSEDTIARIWDAQSGRLLERLEGHVGVIESVAYSPDGRQIATGSGDRTVRIWDAQSGEALLVLEGHDDEVRSVAYNSDGGRLVSSSIDRTARVWDAQDGKQLVLLEGHIDFLESAIFSRDDKKIVTATENQTVRVWEAGSGKLLKNLGEYLQPIASAVDALEGKTPSTPSRDGEEDPQEVVLEEFDAVIESVATSARGSRVVTVFEDGSARIWTARDEQARPVLEGHSGMVYSVATSPDGKRIVTGSNDRTARFWDALTGRQLDLMDLSNRIWSVAYGPKGNRVAIGFQDSKAQVWDVASRKQLAEMKSPGYGTIYSVAFSPDGSRIVTGSADTMARIWDAQSGELLMTLDSNDIGEIYSVSFSPDGARVLTGSSTKAARIWEAQTGRLLLALNHDEGVNSAAYNRVGDKIVTGSDDRITRVWDGASGELLMELKGQNAEISSVAFSPDKTRIVTASKDTTVWIWDAESGQSLVILEGHGDEIASAAFSQDGQRIVTGSRDRTARVWDAAPWRLDDYPGNETHSLMHRYNLWSHERHRGLSR